MGSLQTVIKWLGAAAAVVVLSAESAHAYIDGGTASMLFQLLIAGGLGLIFGIKAFWRQIKTFFSSLRRKDAPADE